MLGCDIQVHESEKAVCLLSESFPPSLDHNKLYEARAASKIFLTSTEKGINNSWKIVIVDWGSSEFPGAARCVVVE